jgi:hypothetical protein
MYKRLKQLKQTRIALGITALVELAIAYGCISLAIDRGNFLWYLLTLVFLVISLKHFSKLIGTFGHGKKLR